MTQRSMNNDRYRTELEGHTKKSASKAKPAKAAASTVYEKGDIKKTRKQLRDEEAIKEQKTKNRTAAKYSTLDRNDINRETKNNAEIRKWRKRWWWCIGIGVAFVVISWFAKDISGVAFITTITLAYVLVGVALWMEFGKIWKIRRRIESGAVEKKTKKQIKHEIEAERLEAERLAAKKNRKKSFFKKKDSDIGPIDYPMDESTK
ncbi:MAG: hypothetical protein ACOYIK_00490 [Coriobacteriales bacterium]|jgi:hypothetical protein